jgi:hypothetical protein
MFSVSPAILKHSCLLPITFLSCLLSPLPGTGEYPKSTVELARWVREMRHKTEAKRELSA